MDMSTGSQTTGVHETGTTHPAKVTNVGTVAKGTHIREEKRPALLMENLVVDVANRITLRLCADPRIPKRKTCLGIGRVMFNI